MAYRLAQEPRRFQPEIVQNDVRPIGNSIEIADFPHARKLDAFEFGAQPSRDLSRCAHANLKPLIVDELSCFHFDSSGAHLLFKLAPRCCQRTAIFKTFNHGVEVGSRVRRTSDGPRDPGSLASPQPCHTFTVPAIGYWKAKRSFALPRKGTPLLEALSDQHRKSDGFLRR